jgi:exopolysaccharide biosynthesis protein
VLVKHGELPWQLRAKGRGADIAHRDSRLALGVRDDGQLIVVLTRFTGLGPAGEQLPWGPTAPEMARWMQSLGCRRAMLLDGGMSSQMAIRRRDGTIERWPNLRPVPMGLVVLPRARAIAAR